jgi:hypothetical protein
MLTMIINGLSDAVAKGLPVAGESGYSSYS